MSRPIAKRQGSFSLQDNLILSVVALYVLVSTFLGWRLMRPVIMRWYRSGTYIVTTSGQSGSFLMGGEMGELLAKQVGMRLKVEMLSVTLGLVVGCLGGNLYYLLTRRRRVAEAQ